MYSKKQQRRFKMTIANQIANANWMTHEEKVQEAEEKATEIRQDCDLGTTTYIFVDMSVLVDSEGELAAYGA